MVREAVEAVQRDVMVETRGYATVVAGEDRGTRGPRRVNAAAEAREQSRLGPQFASESTGGVTAVDLRNEGGAPHDAAEAARLVVGLPPSLDRGRGRETYENK